MKTSILSFILAQRELLVGHLAWVTIFLGAHSFGLYIHNDTMQALGRVEDTISDNAIIMKPILANTLWGLRRQSNTCYMSIIHQSYHSQEPTRKSKQYRSTSIRAITQPI